MDGWIEAKSFSHFDHAYFFLSSVSLSYELFDFTAAGVVPCGGRKTSPHIQQWIIG